MDYTSAGYHFGVLSRCTQAYIPYACRRWKLSYAEYVVIMELYRNDGCSQDELCKLLTADKALIARNAKSLEEKGFICRKRDDADGRVKRIYLTKKGKDIKEGLMVILKRWIHALAKGMDEAAIEQTVQALQLIATNAANVSIEELCREGETME